MADDLGYGDIGCYGNSKCATPNLDKMAKEGIRFTDFHSNGAVCSPTRASLLTGRYQQRTGISGVVTAANHRDVGLAISEFTIGDMMKQQGYTTGIFGKWHVGYPAHFNPIHNGFDQYIGFVSGNVDYLSHRDQEGYRDWWSQDQLTPDKGYSTDLITENSIKFIKQNREKSFFLYIPHEAPHYPIQVRESEIKRTDSDPKGETYKENRTKEELAECYREMITIMDEGIGDVINTLKELDLDDNTIVIFCSDNGGASLARNFPYRGNKGSVWEGGHRVPAIIWYPGKIDAGQESSTTLLTMDLMPTIAALTGGEVPKDVDGIDFSKHILLKESLKERTLFWEHHNNAAVRDGDWKLILKNKAKIPQLYNLKNDPKESNDISSQHPEIVKQMLKKLKEWRENVNRGVKKLS